MPSLWARPLKHLEQLNREPFQLAGVDFDYSGTVLSWRHGELEGVLNRPGRVILGLEPSQDQSQQTDYRSILGDGSFSFGHPAIQRLNRLSTS